MPQFNHNPRNSAIKRRLLMNKSTFNDHVPGKFLSLIKFLDSFNGYNFIAVIIDGTKSA